MKILFASCLTYLLLILASARLHTLTDPHGAGQLNPNDTPAKFEIGWHETQLDHFDFQNNGTFKMKYLFSREFFKTSAEKPGPIFVYTGNEGAIETFWNNSGYWTNVLAPKYGALLLFPEHRYFGDSLPFGKDSFETENLKYLSSEQALADYGVFLRQFQVANNLQNSPVIAFGGSYGGMLSGWFRMKYPQVVDGALAASAPLLLYPGIGDPYAFQAVITEDFTNALDGCGENWRKGFQQLYELRTESQYYSTLTSKLNLCHDITSANDVENLYYWMTSALSYMAMIDYPYPTDFIANVPASPVKASCQKMADVLAAESSTQALIEFLSPMFSMTKKSTEKLPNEPLLKAMVAAANVFYDYEGKATCTNTQNSGTPSLGLVGWDYLACTEQVLMTASNGKTDFFWPSLWSTQAYSAGCAQEFGTPSRPTWVPDHFGGWDYKNDFAMYSNIIFSQGNLDPWHIGGVRETISEEQDLIGFVMKGAAHHLDLRYPNPADPIDVVKGRALEDQYVGKWIEEARARKLQYQSSSLSSDVNSVVPSSAMQPRRSDSRREDHHGFFHLLYQFSTSWRQENR